MHLTSAALLPSPILRFLIRRCGLVSLDRGMTAEDGQGVETVMKEMEMKWVEKKRETVFR